MFKHNLSGLFLGGLLILPINSSAQSAVPVSVSKATDWTRLLTRTDGWTGADGIFSIPLSGFEGPDRIDHSKTLFLFSDTFIGQVDVNGARKNARLINNSLAILDGRLPDSSKMRFLWGKDTMGLAKSVFVPNTPNTRGKSNWYWLQDGFCHNNNVYIFALVETTDSTGMPGFKFRTSGIALIKIPLGLDGEPDLSKQIQMDVPLYYKTGSKTVSFGNGIMPNTLEAGAPMPDGYIYVYGGQPLCVARIPVDSIENSTHWLFWDGKAWNTDIAASAALGEGGSELSVTPIAQGFLKGKYLMVSMSLEPNLYIRIGESPVGPFTARQNVYLAPEWSQADSIYTYNAKAHPSLSANGDWVISYNVNTTSWNRDLKFADIYHPRFVSLRFDPITGMMRLLSELTPQRHFYWRVDGRQLGEFQRHQRLYH